MRAAMAKRAELEKSKGYGGLFGDIP